MFQLPPCQSLHLTENSEFEENLNLNLEYIIKNKSIGQLDISLLQQWLRKKQIFVIVEVDQTCEPKFCYRIDQFFGNPNDLAEKEWGWIHHKNQEWLLYRTYEQALEVGIIDALTIMKENEQF
jgi:hypothetical protein